jgi:hypothetical protein
MQRLLSALECGGVKGLCDGVVQFGLRAEAG